MDPTTTTPAVPDAEAELQRFREQWRAEVARHRRPEAASTSKPNQEQRQEKKRPPPAGPPAPSAGASAARKKAIQDAYDEIEPRAYHDLPDKEELKKLGVDGQHHPRNPLQEPSTALEHYERAVEKETQGNLGDSLTHYRRAFKLDDGVHEAYKKKHFPPSSFVKSKPTNTNPSNAAVTIPQTGHHSLHGSGLSPSLKQLVDDFSSTRIEAAPPPTDASPQQPSPLAELPEEILTQILTILALDDLASFVSLALVCKRLTYLVFTEESIWKPIALGSKYGFAAMHYDFATDIEGRPLQSTNTIASYIASSSSSSSSSTTASEKFTSTLSTSTPAFASLTTHLLHTTYASSYRHMFRQRPRLRFNGCYISTVNYTRAGATSTNTLTWGSPVHVVTYYRYLRFFRDGSCISLLTTAEPLDVVHHLNKENLHAHHHSHSHNYHHHDNNNNTHAPGPSPTTVMKDALHGRWRLTSPASSSSSSSPFPSTTSSPSPQSENAEEEEGTLIIETEGVVPKYTYKLILLLTHAGKASGARNNKLAWRWFGSWNRLTDDWGEFGRRNDRAFYWSRVRGYGDGVGGVSREVGG